MSDYIDRLEAELLRGYHPPRRWPLPAAAVLPLVALVVVLVAAGLGSEPQERAVKPPPAAVVVPLGKIQEGIAVRRDGELICLEHLDNEVCGNEDQYASGNFFGSRPGDPDSFFGLAPLDVDGITIRSTDGRSASVRPREGVWGITLEPSRDPVQDVAVTAHRASSATATAMGGTQWSPDDYSVLRSESNVVEPPDFLQAPGTVHRLTNVHDATTWAWVDGARICLAMEAYPNEPEQFCAPADQPIAPHVRVLPGDRLAVTTLLPDGSSAFLAHYGENAIEGLAIRRNLVSGVLFAIAEEFTWRTPDGAYHVIKRPCALRSCGRSTP